MTNLLDMQCIICRITKSLNTFIYVENVACVCRATNRSVFRQTTVMLVKTKLELSDSRRCVLLLSFRRWSYSRSNVGLSNVIIVNSCRCYSRVNDHSEYLSSLFRIETYCNKPGITHDLLFDYSVDSDHTYVGTPVRSCLMAAALPLAPIGPLLDRDSCRPISNLIVNSIAFSA